MTLTEKIKKAGIDHCLFLVPMRPIRTYLGLISVTSSSDPKTLVPAKIIEAKYKVKDGYKISLKSIYPGFGSEDFYISDLQTLIAEGTIQFFVRS